MSTHQHDEDTLPFRVLPWRISDYPELTRVRHGHDQFSVFSEGPNRFRVENHETGKSSIHDGGPEDWSEEARAAYLCRGYMPHPWNDAKPGEIWEITPHPKSPEEKKHYAIVVGDLFVYPSSLGEYTTDSIKKRFVWHAERVLAP